MLDFIKIQVDILKDFNKGRKCKNRYYFDNSDDTFIYIVFNAVYVLALPRCVCMLDIEKLIDQGACSDHNNCFTSINIYDSMIKKINMLDTESLSFKEFKILKDNKTVAMFEAEKYNLVINKDFFKYVNIDFYNLDEGFNFSGSGKKAPLVLHHDNYFIGLFLPINNPE